MRFEGDLKPGIEAKLLSLTKDELISVMLQALEEMQGYNSQTVQACVVKGMGGEVDSDGMLRVPGLTKIKEYLGCS